MEVYYWPLSPQTLYGEVYSTLICYTWPTEEGKNLLFGDSDCFSITAPPLPSSFHPAWWSLGLGRGGKKLPIHNLLDLFYLLSRMKTRQFGIFCLWFHYDSFLKAMRISHLLSQIESRGGTQNKASVGWENCHWWQFTYYCIPEREKDQEGCTANINRAHT